jgi:hypothetical protein
MTLGKVFKKHELPLKLRMPKEGVAIIVLDLQGGVADGSESTFDGQSMQPGVHLSWGFAPELGFQPGGFWLCRRITKGDEKRIPLPPAAQKTIDQQANPTVFSLLPVDNQWGRSRC